eukprot:388649-Prymnesium_polylepis.1
MVPARAAGVSVQWKWNNLTVEHSQNMYHHNVRRSSWAAPACLGNWQYASSGPTADVIPAEEMGNYTAS